MNPNQNNEVTVRFESDTLKTVTNITAQKLVEIMEEDSLEVLIHLLLRNLAAETGLVPTSGLIAYPLQAKYLPKKEYNLEELMAGVTKENRHERIDFGNPVGRENI